MKLNTLDKFWNLVVKTEQCWEWTGSTNRYGYGRYWYQEHEHPAHRLAYELTYGPVPSNLLVCHRCDNRRCVRPDHLFLGTTADNTRDRHQKQRDARGERVNTAKLTATQVLAIRRLYTEGTTIANLARQYGVSDSAIEFIIHRRNWKHLP